MPPDFEELRRRFVERDYLFTLHASERAAERGILSHEVEAAIMTEQSCRYCSGHLEAQSVTRLQKYQGRWILVENVPALVCRQCGEQYFTPDVHDRIVDLITGDTPPARTETVAVYDAEL